MAATAQRYTTPAEMGILAAQIKLDLVKRGQGDQAWIDATIDLCAHLAEARSGFVGDREFGRWCVEAQINLAKDERAAAIAMGQDLARARAVLTATKRRSLQTIHRLEFCIRNVTKANRPQNRVKRDRAEAALDRQTDAGEKVTYDTIAKEAGVSQTVVAAVLAAREAAAPPALPELSITAQQKLDVHKRRFEAEFENRVRARSMKWLEEVRIPLYEKKIEELIRMLKWPRNSVMKMQEYKLIVMCLHPDGLNSRTEEQLAEAFRIFTHYKPKLVSDEETRQEALRGIPLTTEEMMAHKRGTK